MIENIEFITGTMGGGKSTKLIDFIQDAEKGNESFICLKPNTDTRDGAEIKCRTHSKTYPAITVASDEGASESFETINMLIDFYNPSIIFIDEIQFMSVSFVKSLITLSQLSGIKLVMAGLLKDFKQEYFPASYHALMHTKKAYFLNAGCDKCGKEALHNVKYNALGVIRLEGEVVDVGDLGKYGVLCEICFTAALVGGERSD
ncbi:hypothetical protein V7166_21890 [Bacillus thuringiensis]